MMCLTLPTPKPSRSCRISLFLTDYPPRHRVDIQASDGATYAVCFNDGGASSHEGIENLEMLEGLTLVKFVSEATTAELRE
jgi:hypothetical protein